MIGATNGYDALVALIVGVPATIGAVLALFSWRASRATKVEVTSPNGERSGDAVYEIRKGLIGLAADTSEIKAAQRDHARRDDERFARVSQHLGIDL